MAPTTIHEMTRNLKKQHEPVLLLDFEWQKEEGLKLARPARSISHRKRMPIMPAAAELNSQLETLARRAGVNECVMKTPDMSGGSSQEAATQTEVVPGKSICLTPALLEGIMNKLRQQPSRSVT